jgi:hypothetical protein
MRIGWPRSRFGRTLAWTGVTVLLAASVVAIVWRDFWFQKYAVVREGVLYRSAVLSEGTLRERVREERARTIVNLCDMQDADLAVAKSEGINYVWMLSEQVPTDADADKFVAIMRDPKNHPVHVHCEHGIGRTGVMVALYRTLVEGWTLDSALDEARKYGLYGKGFREGAPKTEFLRRFVPERLAQRAREAAPTAPPEPPADPAQGESRKELAPAGAPEPR